MSYDSKVAENWGDYVPTGTGNKWDAGIIVYEDTSLRTDNYCYYRIYCQAWSTGAMSVHANGSCGATNNSDHSWEGTFSNPYNGGYFTYITYDTWYTRDTSVRTVSAWTTFNVTGGFGNGSSSASVSFSVPAKPSWTVSYNANGGTGAPSSQTKWSGSVLTLSSTKPTRAGHTFRGWATSASGPVVYQPGGNYSDNADVTLYAVWQINTYTISYNVNGGNLSSVPASQTKTHGTNLTLSSTKPTWSGHTFQGWATSANGSVAYQPGAVFSTNADTVLYAIWKANTYTISFNANGGSGSMGSVTKTYGVNLVLPKNTAIKRTNYLFQGWGKTASDTNPTWFDGGTYSDNASATLYAIWVQDRISCTVKFDANGGSNAPASITHWSKSYSTLPSVVPTRDGYEFQGWAASSTALAQTWVSGGLYYNDSFSAGATITLYAVWKRPASFSTLFAVQAGQTVKDVQVQLPSGSSLKGVYLKV